MPASPTICINDLDRVTIHCGKFYGTIPVKQAINALKQWYIDQQFDDDDFTNDWIPNDFQNCDGIDIFTNNLNHSKKIVTKENKSVLFNWFCHWLLPNISQPLQNPTTTTILIDNVAIALKQKLPIYIPEFKQGSEEIDEIVDDFESICNAEDVKYLISLQSYLCETCESSILQITKYTKEKDLKNDFESINDSFILDEIIDHYPKFESYRPKIFKILNHILHDNYLHLPFNISYVTSQL